MSQSLLCLDIGSGTQDVLYYIDGFEIENCPKFILPSPARRIGARIKELTAAGRDIYLSGTNMGGGFTRAVTAHAKAGLKVYAHPEAALALGDDLKFVEAKGVSITESMPQNTVQVHLADYDPGFWRAFLSAAGLEEPDRIMASVQDHGFHPGKSNRIGRFNLWKKLLIEDEGRPECLLFNKVPVEFTRLAVLQKSIGYGVVCDTGAAAVLGILYDEDIVRMSFERGICLLNIGNSHIISFLLFAGRIYGVYEHHTGLRTAEELWADLKQFRAGKLTFENVFDSRGHGCITLDLPPEAAGFEKTFVIGPQRRLLEGYDAVYPSPGGDMMLAGCFGLLKGMELNNER